MAYDEPDEDEDFGADVPPDESCPACHSDDVVPFSIRRRVGQALIVLILGTSLMAIPLPVAAAWPVLGLTIGIAVFIVATKPDYRCIRCAKRWVRAGRMRS